MSEEFDDTNRGVLWINDRKKRDEQPDYRGQINVDGVEYWCSMWVDPTVSGKRPPIILSFHLKEDPGAEKTPQREQLEALKTLAGEPAESDPSDDIPF